MHARIGRAVLAQHQPAARTDHEVVRHVQHLGTRRLVDQPDRLVANVEFPYLPHLGVAAIGAGDEHAAAGVPRPLETAEDGTAAFQSLFEHATSVEGGRVDVRFAWLLDRHPVDAQRLAGLLALSQVGAGPAIDSQHLQPPTVSEAPR